MRSFTISGSVTFTATHARHLASKVSTDLKRMQRFYGEPSNTSIAQYEEELVELLKAGYLGTLTLGYKKDDNWIEPTLRYTARDLNEMQSADDDPGKVRPGADISGATFYNTSLTQPMGHAHMGPTGCVQETHALLSRRSSGAGYIRVPSKLIGRIPLAAVRWTVPRYGVTDESAAVGRTI